MEAVKATYYSNGVFIYDAHSGVEATISDMTRNEIMHMNIVDEYTQARLIQNLRTLRDMMGF